MSETTNIAWTDSTAERRISSAAWALFRLRSGLATMRQIERESARAASDVVG